MYQHTSICVYICIIYIICHPRVRQCKADKAPVIDVDGTYLERKRQRLLSSNLPVVLLPCPAFPLRGWQIVQENNAKEIAKDMPSVSQSTLYTYLAEGVWNAKGAMAFRALKRGYIHWASGCLKKLEVQTRHPHYVFVRGSMIPSMRVGTYVVMLMLKKQTIGD